jgi:hypothetical protein
MAQTNATRAGTAIHTGAVAQIVAGLARRQYASLPALLDSLPWDGLSSKLHDELLVKLVNYAQDWEGLDLLLTSFRQENTGEHRYGNLPVATRLFYLPGVTQHLLSLVAENTTYLDHCSAMLGYEDSGRTLSALGVLEGVYGPQEAATYRALLSQAQIQEARERYGNQCVLEFLLDKVRESVTEVCPTPGWVRRYDLPLQPLVAEIDEDDLGGTGAASVGELAASGLVAFEEEFVIPESLPPPRSALPDDQVIADVLLAAARDAGVPVATQEETRQQLLGYVQHLNPDQKAELLADRDLAHWQARLEEDETLSRLLGPCNRGLARCGAGPCDRYGGCRMFLCTEHDRWTEDGVTDEDTVYVADNLAEAEDYWFGGRCLVCWRLIAAKHYAVRLPLTYGGWLGCYCSWVCARRAIPDQENLVQLNLVAYAEEFIQRVGIADRRYSIKQRTEVGEDDSPNQAAGMALAREQLAAILDGTSSVYTGAGPV